MCARAPNPNFDLFKASDYIDRLKLENAYFSVTTNIYTADCQPSLDLFYIVACYTKWVQTY